MAKQYEGAWSLATGMMYTDGPGGGTFSPRLPVSEHHFGWIPKSNLFVVKNQRGMGGVSYNTMSVPLELAEAFLLRCIDDDFHEKALNNMFPSEDFEEVISVNTARLKVRRPKAIINFSGPSTIPGIYLDLEMVGVQNSVRSISLFSDLRASFAKRIRRFNPAQIKRNLRVPVNKIAPHS
jgi:hypothetical protein